MANNVSNEALNFENLFVFLPVTNLRAIEFSFQLGLIKFGGPS